MRNVNILVKTLVMVIPVLSMPMAFAGGGGAGGEIVFDPTNYIENTVTALKTAQSVINEAQMVQNQLMQIKNEAINLKNIPDQTWRDATGDLQNLANDVRQGQALAYSMDNLDQRYRQMYPTYDKYDATNYSKQYEQWSGSTQDIIDGSLTSLHTSSKNMDSELGTIKVLQHQSQSTEGRLQALQVGTEVAAEQLNQMYELRQVIMTQTNAENQFQALQVQKGIAEEKSVSEVLQNNKESFPQYQNNPDFGVIPDFN